VTGQTTIAASTATTSAVERPHRDGPFAGALFLEAFLLFVREPMVAKGVLPTLGGTPMAWNTLGHREAVTQGVGHEWQSLIHGVTPGPRHHRLPVGVL
jgi:hypothetical protein